MATRFLPVAPGFGVAGTVEVDTFGFWKGVVTVALGVAALFVLSLPRIGKRLADLPRAVSLAGAGFLLALWLASVLSPDPERAVFGMPHHREGALVWTAYLALFLLATAAGRANRAKTVVDALLAGSALLWGLGIFEFFSLPPFERGFLSWLVPGRIFSTLGHGNYLGVHAAMVLPLVLVRLLRVKATGALVAMTALAVLGVAVLFGSQARGGMLAAAVSLAATAWAMRSEVQARWKRLAGSGALSVVTVAGMAPFADGQLLAKTRDGLTDVQAIATPAGAMPFQALDVTRADARISYRGTVLRIYATGAELIFTRDDGFPLSTQVEGGTGRFEDPAYAAFHFLPRTSELGNLIVLEIDDYSLPFLVEPGRFGLATTGDAFATERPKLAFGTTSFDLLLSGRFYIWNRALPLLADNLLVGAGPDAFALEFPQRDYLGKLNVYRQVRTVVEGPHCLYLQILHAGGVVLLLSVLLIWGSAFVRAPVGLAGSLAGYLVGGLVNDGVIGVSVVAWVLAGLAISSQKIYEN